MHFYSKFCLNLGILSELQTARAADLALELLASFVLGLFLKVGHRDYMITV